ncbi:MAG: hypothetical protein VZT48_02330 [Bulleidia sp.]|nr:hypothetical protein [Bulleidia sp.]
MKYTVIVDSCDKYADCWLPMSQCMEKFWPEAVNENAVVLITDGSGKKPVAVDLSACRYAEVIEISERNFGALLKKALRRIDSELVFLILDDQWPGSAVRTDLLEQAADIMANDGTIGVIYSEAMPEKRVHEWHYSSSGKYPFLYEIPFGTPYRMSLAPALWRKDFLIDILQDEDTAWDFERKGSFRDITSVKNALRFKESAYDRCAPVGAIEKGMWLLEIKKFGEKNNITIDFSGRHVESRMDVFKSSCKSFVYNLNPDLIVRIQNKIGK